MARIRANSSSSRLRTAPLLVAAGLLVAGLGVWAEAQLGVTPQPPPESDPTNPPAPYQTPSASNGASVISRPPGAAVNVPPGFTVNEFATNLSAPRTMLPLPNGDLLVAEYGGGRVDLLRDANGDGQAETKKTLLQNLDHPFGLQYRDGLLYVAQVTKVVRAPYTVGSTTTITATPETIITGLPAGGHSTRNLLFSEDGTKLYVAVGSANNLAEEAAPRARIMEYSNNFTSSRVYASGLRNPVGLARNPANGELWTCVNERDGLGDNVPPDYATSVKDGGFYGWPYAYMGQHPDPTYGAKRFDMVSKSLTPDVPVQAHSAALGIAFTQGGRFPSGYNGGLFIACHGSWNREKKTAYHVLFQPFQDGKPVGRPVVFANGWLTANQQVWGRPVGLAFDATGALLVSDDGGNKIWRIAPNLMAGDVNGDGAVNIQDTVLALRAIVGLSTLTAAQQAAADLSPPGAPDGRITIADAVALLRLVVGTG